MTEADLRDDPGRYSLFAALKVIERSHLEGPLLGRSRRLRDDPVRLRQPPYLTFVTSEVATFDSGVPAPQLAQYAFGLMGPNGPLPLHLTEYAFERLHQHNDPTLADFLSAFQHRATTLFYRAWAEGDPATQAEQVDTDPFRRKLGALVGMGEEAALNRDAVPDAAKLSRAGLFATHNRSATALARLISDAFEVPARVEEFVGTWLPIPEHSLLRLAGDPESATLGVSSSIGRESWQREFCFELQLGPLSFRQLEEFLPGSGVLDSLRSLVGLYSNRQWSWRVRLVLNPGEAPGACLGKGVRLGWTTWLGAPVGQVGDVSFEGDSLS
jgi:type VI secretion system protein ImpH